MEIRLICAVILNESKPSCPLFLYSSCYCLRRKLGFSSLLSLPISLSLFPLHLWFSLHTPPLLPSSWKFENHHIDISPPCFSKFCIRILYCSYWYRESQKYVVYISLSCLHLFVKQAASSSQLGIQMFFWVFFSSFLSDWLIVILSSLYCDLLFFLP